MRVCHLTKYVHARGGSDFSEPSLFYEREMKMKQYIPDITERFPEGYGGVDMTPGLFWRARLTGVELIKEKRKIMKIEILMLKENNERGVRMMFLSLEQLQKLKLNPTRADYEIAYETEVKEQEGTALNVSEIMEGLYERLNRPDRPNRKTMRSMSVGDIIQIDGKELFFCDSVGFKKISFAGTGELVLKAGKENSEKGK